MMISITNIHYTYPGGIRALDGVSLDVPEGCFISVMGANGSGKSTLLKHINGLLEPEAGSIRVGGVLVTGKSFEAINHRIGFVFQDPNDQIFATTAREDIMYGPFNLGLPEREIERRVQETAAQVGISDLLDRPIHHLSYGQKKRLSIAGVLAMKPDCLVLDEPTASLDPMGERKLMRILHGLNRQGMTVVMATHDVDLVPLYSERVCLLMDGRVAAEGGPKDVFADRELIERCRLRLPRISYLFEAVPNISELPLTVGMARRRLERMMAPEERTCPHEDGLMGVEGEIA
jgi:cobalt transport protein ATP-binding subunit